MAKENEPQKKEEQPANPSKRRFLKWATITALGLTVVDLSESFGQTVESSYYSHHFDLRPDEKTLAKANEVIADYTKKAEEAGKSGNIDLSKSIDATKVKNAYKVIDQDRNPQKYHPAEYAREEQARDTALRDSLKMTGLSIISTALGGILAFMKISSEAKEAPKKNSGNRPTITVTALASGRVETR